MSARHSAPLIFRLCPSMVNLPAYMEKRQRFMARASRWIMPRQGKTPRAMQPGHGGEGADPRSKRGKCDVDGIVSVADHSKGRQHIPDRTPVRGPNPAPAGHRGVKEYVGRVCRGGGGKDADSDRRIDGKVHVCLSAMSLRWFRRRTELGGAVADHLIASGLVGDPTAPVIGIAGATNMNS